LWEQLSFAANEVMGMHENCSSSSTMIDERYSSPYKKAGLIAGFFSFFKGKLCCYLIKREGIVEFRFRMLAFRWACGEPNRRMNKDPYSKIHVCSCVCKQILPKRVSSSHALRVGFSGTWHAAPAEVSHLPLQSTY
jgi:hypothetical protein